MELIRNMRPSFLLQNAMNFLKTNWKTLGDLRERISLIVHLSNFLDIVFHKLVIWSAFAAIGFAKFSSAFCVHVSNIVYLGSKKQMIRIATSSIVAFVQNLYVRIGYFPIGQFIGDPMGLARFSIKPKFSISKRIFISRPFPAFIWRTDMNLIPKSLHIAPPATIITQKGGKCV